MSSRACEPPLSTAAGLTLQDVRAQFPWLPGRLHFNHAAVAPLPKCSAEAVARVAHAQAGLADTGYDELWGELAVCRERLATLLGANAGEVAFVKNTTQGIIIAAQSVAWREGDNVVTTGIEFPANIYPWLHLARRGVHTRLVPPRGPCLEIDDIAAATDEHTRVLAVSWVQFVNGFRLDLAQLAQLCRERRAYLVVDAIQGLGALRLDVRQAGVDMLSADGHKWLLGPEGAGCLFVSERVLEELEPTNVGWMSVTNRDDHLSYDLTLRADAARYEEGTHNLLGISGLSSSVGLLLQFGPDRVEERVLGNTAELVEGLLARGCEVVSSQRPQHRSGIVAFRRPDEGPQATCARLCSRGIRCGVRGGAVRLSPHFYNDAEDVARALGIVGRCT